MDENIYNIYTYNITCVLLFWNCCSELLINNYLLNIISHYYLLNCCSESFQSMVKLTFCLIQCLIYNFFFYKCVSLMWWVKPREEDSASSKVLRETHVSMSVTLYCEVVTVNCGVSHAWRSPRCHHGDTASYIRCGYL